MELCRLCFSETNLQLSKNLFDNQQSGPPILDVIATLTDLKLCESGPYSKITCMDCYEKLINFYDFRQVVLQTDLKFHLKFSRGNRNINDERDIIMQQNVQIKTEQNCDNNETEISNSYNWIQQEIDKQIESNKEIDKCALVIDKIDQDIVQPMGGKVDDTCEYSNNCNMIKTEANLHENSNEYMMNENLESRENQVIFDRFKPNIEENLSEPPCNIGAIKDEICANDDGTVMNSCFSDETQTVHLIPDNSNTVQVNKHKEDEDNFIKESKIEIQEYYPVVDNNETDRGRIHGNSNVSIEIVRRKRGRSYRLEKRFKCNICGRVFIKETDLKIHITPNNIKPYRCHICCKTYESDDGLNEHLITHTYEKRYDCNMCDKEFKRKALLDNHIRVHTGEKPYECVICKAKFSANYKLRNHIKIEHTVIEKPYKCYVCYKKFTTVNNLSYHLRSHSDIDKPYKCTYCNKRFSYGNSLNVHLRLHTGENLYKCNICDRGFSQEVYLNNHLPVHTRDQQ